MAGIVVVVPCYNEAARLDVHAFESFSLARHDVSFLFVNDGSTDDTQRVLERLRDETGARVLRLERNVGKAEAVRRGIVAALEENADYVGFWDADLAAPLAELDEFVALMERDSNVEIVYGSRVKLMGRSIERHAWRHYVGRVAATLISTTLALPIYDTQGGHKLFRATDMLERVFRDPFTTKWLFDVEILARFLTMDPRGREHVVSIIHELPLRRWVDVRGSKVKALDFAASLRDVWSIKAKYRL